MQNNVVAFLLNTYRAMVAFNKPAKQLEFCTRVTCGEICGLCFQLLSLSKFICDVPDITGQNDNATQCNRWHYLIQSAIYNVSYVTLTRHWGAPARTRPCVRCSICTLRGANHQYKFSFIGGDISYHYCYQTRLSKLTHSPYKYLCSEI